MRDWSSYNESLVRRGQVLLDFDVIDNWYKELEIINKGKVGEPYSYPSSFLQLVGYMRIYFHLPYRQTEGVVKAHEIKYHSTLQDINRRVNRLDTQINENASTFLVQDKRTLGTAA